MYDSRAIGIGSHGDIFYGVAIDACALHLFLLSAVDGGVCGTVDDMGDVVVDHISLYGFGIGKIELFDIGVEHRTRKAGIEQRAKFISELSVGSGN